MSPFDPPICVTFSASYVPICLWLFLGGCRRMVGFSDGYGQKCTDYRYHRAGRLLPGRAAARQRLRSRSASSGARAPPTTGASSTCSIAIQLRPADLLDQLSLIRVIDEVRPHEFYNLAAMSFVPASWDQPMLTGEFNAQGVTRVLEADPPGRSVDPALPGVVQRDVRQGARGAADRADAVLSAQPVRRVEGVRPLHHGQLPRELRPVRRARASCSITNRRAAAWSS